MDDLHSASAEILQEAADVAECGSTPPPAPPVNGGGMKESVNGGGNVARRILGWFQGKNTYCGAVGMLEVAILNQVFPGEMKLANGFTDAVVADFSHFLSAATGGTVTIGFPDGITGVAGIFALWFAGGVVNKIFKYVPKK